MVRQGSTMPRRPSVRDLASAVAELREELRNYKRENRNLRQVESARWFTPIRGDQTTHGRTGGSRNGGHLVERGVTDADLVHHGVEGGVLGHLVQDLGPCRVLGQFEVVVVAAVIVLFDEQAVRAEVAARRSAPSAPTTGARIPGGSGGQDVSQRASGAGPDHSSASVPSASHTRTPPSKTEDGAPSSHYSTVNCKSDILSSHVAVKRKECNARQGHPSVDNG